MRRATTIKDRQCKLSEIPRERRGVPCGELFFQILFTPASCTTSKLCFCGVATGESFRVVSGTSSGCQMVCVSNEKECRRDVRGTPVAAPLCGMSNKQLRCFV